VSKENIRLQVSALRKALGADRDVIHTEFGRGYRFTGVLGSTAATESCRPTRSKPPSGRILFPWSCRPSLQCSVNRPCTEHDSFPISTQ
jgi:DNA-binding winged helix-turn-helix (wHTH) protein